MDPDPDPPNPDPGRKNDKGGGGGKKWQNLGTFLYNEGSVFFIYGSGSEFTKSGSGYKSATLLLYIMFALSSKLCFTPGFHFLYTSLIF
jgi:hypothetical protein